MSSYGHDVMILSFCISGTKAAVHTGDAGLNSTWSNFCSIISHYNSESDKNRTSKYQSIDEL